ncbi:hypothetical protein [Pseudomonas sp. MRSN 12121]|uniref:hypothetical protein n=1 Tax=Pseudomonas sp. MRSN 12121 TaxID=1611770 RepID=UPI0005BED716|nr:hypothetical protein [Pseudomonas sp. MRSN 12121]AJO77136.1 hypothetical protein TO66_07425 [Pseudomonas sp. MRSN 12121]
MKRTILTVIARAALLLGATLAMTAVHAEEQQAVPVTPAPVTGSPGTATPTPYPQVTPPSTPKAGAHGGAPLLPPIDMPKPPKDQPLPTLEQNETKPRTPGG